MSAYPYPGLRPFERHESDVFFGQEEQVDALLDRLARTRFLAVVGTSGCGKSSLVRAGLIPALDSGFMAAAGARWRVAVMRPRAQPLAGLARALIAPDVLGPFWDELDGAAGFVRADLARGPLGLVEAVEESGLPAEENLLVVVDQFEEVFRFGDAAGRDEATAFVALLLASAASARARIYVVLTMRADFIGDCALFHGLPTALNEGQFLASRMTRDQLRRAILGPAGVFGFEVAPKLVNRLLNDLGCEPDLLPVVQHALMRTWMYVSRGREADNGTLEEALEVPPETDGEPGFRLTVEDYEAVGGFERALSEHADAAFDRLDDEGKHIAETLFRLLSERGNARTDERRPTRLGVVAEVAGVAPEAVAAVVDVFREPGRSFVTPAPPTLLGVDTVLDLSHESLIRRWRRMSHWADHERRAALIYRRVEDTARLWQREQAALFRGRDLDIALTWRERHDDRIGSLAAWASRYGDAFDTAMRFLDQSEDERRAREQKAEARRREEITRLEREASREREIAAERAETIDKLSLFSKVMTGLTLLAIVLMFSAGIAWNRARQAEEAAVDAEAATERARARAWIQRSRQLPSSLLGYARDALARSEPELASLLARQAHRFAGRTRQAAHLADAAQRLGIDLETLGAVADELPPASPLEIRQVLAEIARTSLYGAQAGSHAGVVRTVAFSPDGGWLASGGGDRTVRLWQVTGKVLRPQAGAGGASKGTVHDDVVRRVAFSADGRWLAAAINNGQVVVWRFAGGRLEHHRTFNAHRLPARTVAFHPSDPTLLASAGKDGSVHLWRIDAEDARRPFAAWRVNPAAGERGPVEVFALDWSPDGRWLAYGTAGRGFALCAPPDGCAGGEVVTEETLHLRAEPVRAAHFDPRGELMVSAGVMVLPADAQTEVADTFACGDDAVCVYGVGVWALDLAACAVQEPACLRRVQILGHADLVRSLRFSPDGDWLYGGTSAGDLLVWRRRAARPADAEVGAGGRAEDADAATADRGWAPAWPFEPTPRRSAGHEGWVFAIDHVPAEGTDPDRPPRPPLLVSAGKDQTLRVWRNTWREDLERQRAQLLDVGAQVRSLAFRGEGSAVLWHGDDQGRIGRAVFVDGGLHAGETLRDPVHEGGLRDLAVSPDGRWLVSGGRDGHIRVEHTGTGAATFLLDPGPDGMWAVAFPPPAAWRREALVATAGYDRQIRLWRIAAAGDERAEATEVWAYDLAAQLDDARQAYVRDLAFSGDGATLAAATWDGRVLLLPAASSGAPTGHRQLAVRGRDGRTRDTAGMPVRLSSPVSSLAFVPPLADGGPEVLAAGVWDGRIYIWRLDRPDACPVALADADRGAVDSVAFTARGVTPSLAAGHEDGSVSVWSLAGAMLAADDGACPAPERLTPSHRPERAHAGRVFAVAFSPDGNWLVSGGRDGKIRAQPMLHELVERVCERVARNLGCTDWLRYVGPLNDFPYETTCGNHLPSCQP